MQIGHRRPRRNWADGQLAALQHDPRRRLAPAVLGVTLAIGAFMLVGWSSDAQATRSTTTTTASRTSPDPSVVAHDEAAVAAMYGDCGAFSPTRHCPFGAVATTTDGSGGLLYGILLTAQTGDDCERGIAFIFQVERLLGSTSDVPPYSGGGVVALKAAGPQRFAVGYGVSPSTNTSCAENGSAGTDTYVYAWNGSALHLVSGEKPPFPEVIVGYEVPVALGASTAPNPVAVCRQSAPKSCGGYPSASSPTYSIVVANTGSVPLPNAGESAITLTVFLPSFVSHLHGDWGGTNPHGAHTACQLEPAEGVGQDVICQLGVLAPGAAWYASVIGTVTARRPGGQFVISATAAFRSHGKALIASEQVTTLVK